MLMKAGSSPGQLAPPEGEMRPMERTVHPHAGGNATDGAVLQEEGGTMAGSRTRRSRTPMLRKAANRLMDKHGGARRGGIFEGH